MRAAGALVLLVACGGGEGDPGDAPAEASPCVVDTSERCGPWKATVERVIDGDTVELGDGTRLRYLDVDAPELSTDPPECQAEEAQAFNEQLVLGRTVYLEYEEACLDRYERLLALVCTGGRMVNEVLLQRGYARVLVIPPNEAHAARMESLEDQARDERAGIWGLCGFE